MGKILFCDKCGTDAVWPKSVDHLEFPLDEEWPDEVVQSLEWICENGHEGEPMVGVLVPGLSHARVAETMTYSEFLVKSKSADDDDDWEERMQIAEYASSHGCQRDSVGKAIFLRDEHF